MIRGLGYIEDEPDDRDFSIAGLGLPSNAPSSASISQHVLNVLDQGPLGACVMNTLAQGVRTRSRAQGNDEREIFSRLFGHWHACNQNGNTLIDAGTSIRTGIKVLNKLGRPPEKAWTYTLEDYANDPRGAHPPKWTRKPPPHVAMTAMDRRTQAFYRVYQQGDARASETKSAIASGIPIAFGTDVDRSFMDLGPNEIADIPRGAVIGGHATLATEYNEHWIGGPNSWGTDHGTRGFWRMTWGYFTWLRTRDIWALDLPAS